MAICALAASGLSISALAQGAGAGERRLGAEAYNAGNYAAAVEHFKNALRADPDNITSRLHLANAYVRSFRGDAGETPADSPWLQRAREQYEQALQRDRKNKVAVGGLISLDMTTGRMAEAALLARHLAETDPKSWEAYQTLGYLDWVAAYKPIAEARGRATQAPDPSVRRRLRDQFLPILEDGQRVLQTALELEPDSADSMVFMNLTLRSKAALTDDPAEAKDLIASADQWTQKAIAGQAKWREKVKHDLEAAIDPESAPAAAAPVALPAPPPPPPPPPPGYAGEQTKAPPPPPPAEQKAEKDAPPPPPPPAQRKGSRKVPSPPPAAEPDAQKEPPPPPPPPPPKRKSSRKMPPPPPPPPPKQ
jgi:tetratricopeptide (TPR) repeat protein